MSADSKVFKKICLQKWIIPVYLGTFKDLSGMHSLYGDDLCRQPNFLILYNNKSLLPIKIP